MPSAVLVRCVSNGAGHAKPPASRVRVVHSRERVTRITMVKRPTGMNAFEFAVLCGLRAAQLQRGCTPRVPPSEKIAVTAQHELAERKVLRCTDAAEPVPNPSAGAELDTTRSPR